MGSESSGKALDRDTADGAQRGAIAGKLMRIIRRFSRIERGEVRVRCSVQGSRPQLKIERGRGGGRDARKCTAQHVRVGKYVKKISRKTILVGKTSVLRAQAPCGLRALRAPSPLSLTELVVRRLAAGRASPAPRLAAGRTRCTVVSAAASRTHADTNWRVGACVGAALSQASHHSTLCLVVPVGAIVPPSSSALASSAARSSRRRRSSSMLTPCSASR